MSNAAKASQSAYPVLTLQLHLLARMRMGNFRQEAIFPLFEQALDSISCKEKVAQAGAALWIALTR